ncbi:hypothetical protein [Citrobacter braakii]|uniref:hypothetical protein n=1 Tax=Citrobacter braakii TaxID=57706 RepID=UPI001907EFA5|nr:hypothetical protein [Citrobacter braakii]MBJ8955689.1 hypothetical protein [Citrobacter braakii]MCZ5391418.1 hypothetical protein [Citrobacter braakii]
MIDQNTVVHVSFGMDQDVNLGKIAIFEYTVPGSNGRLKITFSHHEDPFNKSDIAEIMKRATNVVELTLISDNQKHAYTVILEEVKLKTGEGWELLELTAVRV